MSTFPPLPPPQPPRLPRDIETVTRTSQIIAIALIMGVVIFSGIALVIGQGGQAPANAPAPANARVPMLAYIAAGFAVVTVPMSIVLPRLITARELPQIRRAAPEEQLPRLWGTFQTRLIVGLALLEGPAFFVIVSYIVDRQLWSMGVAAGLVVLMAMRFPTQYSIEAWVEDQKRLMDLDL